MKWPEAGRRPSKRERGRDKLNEPKEKTRPSLLSYTLERAETFSIKELREKRKKKKRKGEREREKRTKRVEKKKGDEAGRNKVPCQAGCTVSRETPCRVSLLPASF